MPWRDEQTTGSVSVKQDPGKEYPKCDTLGSNLAKLLPLHSVRRIQVFSDCSRSETWSTSQ